MNTVLLFNSTLHKYKNTHMNMEQYKVHIIRHPKNHRIRYNNDYTIQEANISDTDCNEFSLTIVGTGY